MRSHRIAAVALSAIFFGAASIGAGCGAAGEGEPTARERQALSSGVVISGFYGAGGNTGATWQNDYVELFNRGASSVSLSGMSLQYASSSGTSWSLHPLTATTLAPGQYWLVQLQGGSIGSALPVAADESGTAINMAAASGKLALVNGTTKLSCTACGTDANVLDFVGFGAANDSETAPTSALSTTSAAVRNGGGCVESDDNASDFTIAATSSVTLHNGSSTLAPCGPMEAGTDTGVADTAVADTAIADTAVADTAIADTAVADTAVPDTAVPDTAVPDTDVPDTDVPDTDVPDTAVADSGSKDTGVADTGAVDSGKKSYADDPPAAACGCEAPGRAPATRDLRTLGLAVVGLALGARTRGRKRG